MLLHLLRCLALWTVLVVPAAGVEGTFEEARELIEREEYAEAERILEREVRREDGGRASEPWYLLATVRLFRCDIEGAREASERAQALASTPDDEARSSKLGRVLSTDFGLVDVVTDLEDVITRLDIEASGEGTNSVVAAYLERLPDHLPHTWRLPGRIGLPTGSYTINGVPATVRGGELTAVHLRPRDLRLPLFQRLRRFEVELGAGMSTWAGRHVSHMLPGAHLRAVVGVGVGPMVLGVLGGWDPAGYDDPSGGSRWSLAGWSVGARVGVELPIKPPARLRPYLVYSYGRIPGLRVPCEAAGGSFACSQDTTPELLVHAATMAHVPALELALDLLGQGRPHHAVGLRLQVAQAFGRRSASGSAPLGDSTITYAVDSASQAWTGTSVRLLATVTFAP